MIRQRNSKIYIATQRGILHYAGCELYCTLNYAEYWNTAKKSIGCLSNLCEVFLSEYQKHLFSFKENLIIVVIAVYNNAIIHYEGKRLELNPGQIMVVSDSSTIYIENPNEEECSFLLFTLNTNTTTITGPVVEDLSINVIKNEFQALHILPSVKIASVDARYEIMYSGGSQYNGSFLYNLNGSFEAVGCLVGPRDGLAVMDKEPFEIEAFEPNTIILLIEL